MFYSQNGAPSYNAFHENVFPPQIPQSSTRGEARMGKGNCYDAEMRQGPQKPLPNLAPPPAVPPPPKPANGRPRLRPFPLEPLPTLPR
ncbi:hypothetical protein IscW_ISCW013981 [Ixodes scapularis]|uniref:Uncharacterized protein n=1 Tax=Ixodes scapularis TaxID=6945 RepID=B7QK10_IXOSC|nr:hypothetical protein IscW_ISCW013981 [Ixodes scapularis]|eukprot:XP_002415517.1 hypothetical protein IscW_ISCW013981 [Ixodes scapularis]